MNQGAKRDPLMRKWYVTHAHTHKHVFAYVCSPPQIAYASQDECAAGDWIAIFCDPPQSANTSQGAADGWIAARCNLIHPRSVGAFIDDTHL